MGHYKYLAPKTKFVDCARIVLRVGVVLSGRARSEPDPEGERARPGCSAQAPLLAALHLMLESYLDESFTTEDVFPRVMVIAGWFGEGSVWRTVEGQWRDALRNVRPRTLKEFKTGDSYQGAGEQDGWGPRKRDKLRAKLTNILLSADIRGVVSALVVEGPLPKRADYHVAIQYCMEGLVHQAFRYPVGERVTFVIDQKDKVKNEVEATRIWLQKGGH